MDLHGEPVSAAASVERVLDVGFWPMKPVNSGAVQVGDQVVLLAAGKDGKFAVATARVQVRETFNPKSHGRKFPLEIEGERGVCLVLADINQFEEPKPIKPMMKSLSIKAVTGEIKKITDEDFAKIVGKS